MVPQEELDGALLTFRGELAALGIDYSSPAVKAAMKHCLGDGADFETLATASGGEFTAEIQRAFSVIVTTACSLTADWPDPEGAHAEAIQDIASMIDPENFIE